MQVSESVKSAFFEHCKRLVEQNSWAGAQVANDMEA